MSSHEVLFLAERAHAQACLVADARAQIEAIAKFKADHPHLAHDMRDMLNRMLVACSEMIGENSK